jgi:hypothetical protein
MARPTDRRRQTTDHETELQDRRSQARALDHPRARPPPWVRYELVAAPNNVTRRREPSGRPTPTPDALFTPAPPRPAGPYDDDLDDVA